MLRCTLLLISGEDTSCCVARFCCASVNTLHVTLRACVFYFGENASCFAARVRCFSVTKLHIALRTSVVLR